MEDPKRLRTKLRLDLNDVRQQIEDLEKIIQKDKSEENLKTLEKLIGYEKKLKAQYEEMTGITLDQATSLTGVIDMGEKKSTFPYFLGILGGILFAWGYYNAILQGLVGFEPQDVLNYFLDSEGSIDNPYSLSNGLRYETSNRLIVYPIAASLILVLLRGLLANSRSKIVELIDSLAFIATGAYFVYLVEMSKSDPGLIEDIEENLIILGLVLLVSGIIIIFTVVEVKGVFNKMLKFSVGVLIIFSSILFFNISYIGRIPDELAWQWPWLIAPLAVAGFLNLLYDFSQLRMISKANKALS
ncbi:MAG: hypothetical protein ACXAD7_02110 [Candidatus Kariarchaeaceae archaeon]|jgi:hypothetical protein